MLLHGSRKQLLKELLMSIRMILRLCFALLVIFLLVGNYAFESQAAWLPPENHYADLFKSR
jgi:hypothetical protein